MLEFIVILIAFAGGVVIGAVSMMICVIKTFSK